MDNVIFAVTENARRVDGTVPIFEASGHQVLASRSRVLLAVACDGMKIELAPGSVIFAIIENAR